MAEEMEQSENAYFVFYSFLLTNRQYFYVQRYPPFLARKQCHQWRYSKIYICSCVKWSSLHMRINAHSGECTEFGGFWTKGEQRREVLRFVWSSVRLHTVTNKLPRFTGYNSGGTSSTRGKRKMRENGDGQERIVYVRTGKRTGSRGTYIVW